MLENQNNEAESTQASEDADAIIESVFGASPDTPATTTLVMKPKKSKSKKKKPEPDEKKSEPVEIEPVEIESAEIESVKEDRPNVDSKNGFSDLPLSPEVQKAIKNSGYEQPTPIQSEIIPHLLVGRDVLAQSQTGTGKTAAFAFPILTRIETDCKTPQVLVLVPTRELAIQVAKSFADYGSEVPGFQHAVIYGGQDYEIQFRQLRRGPQVVVGTPGRVIDHIKKGTLNISEIECLVLDEADEMLNMGFLEDVKFVLERAPKHRQIALFSATLPTPIRNIAERYLHDPAKVTIKKKTMTADSIRQRAVFVSPRDRTDLLIRFLEAETTDGVIVFTRTRETTSVLAEKLSRAGINAVALNGEMPQKTRERTIQRLKAGQLDVLVATDVAARGLDVSRISHVFNFDMPEGSEAYIHRVGRTGRAGKAGEAIIFLTHSQRSKLRFIEKATRQPIEIVDPPSTQQINKTRIEKFKASIDETIANQDLGFYQKLLNEYAQQSDQPFELIAAAVANMNQDGRDFLMRDRPQREQRDRKPGRERGSNRERFSGPPEAGMARYRIAVGKRDGVRPGNIVGAVTNEANIDGQEIGSIRIHDSYSTIDLPENKAAEIVDSLHDTRVAGRPMNLRAADERDERSSRPRNRRGGSDFGSGDSKSYGGKKKGGKWQKSKRRSNASFSKNNAGDSKTKTRSKKKTVAKSR